MEMLVTVVVFEGVGGWSEVSCVFSCEYVWLSSVLRNKSFTIVTIRSLLFVPHRGAALTDFCSDGRSSPGRLSEIRDVSMCFWSVGLLCVQSHG